MSVTIHLPADIFLLPRQENFAFERFAYNVLTIMVPALQAAGLPNEIAVHVDVSEELLDVWISSQLGEQQEVAGFEVHASVLTPLVLLGICDRFGQQLFDQSGVGVWSGSVDAFRMRTNKFCGSLGELVRDCRTRGPAACVGSFLSKIEFDAENLRYSANLYDLALKFVANHETAHAYVGQFTKASGLSIDDRRSFEFIADILATEWLYNTMIRNTPDTPQYRAIRQTKNHSESILANTVWVIQSQILVLLAFVLVSAVDKRGPATLDGGRTHPHGYLRCFIQRQHLMVLVLSNQENYLKDADVKRIDDMWNSCIKLFVDAGLVTDNDLATILDLRMLDDLRRAGSLIEKYNITLLKKAAPHLKSLVQIVSDMVLKKSLSTGAGRFCTVAPS